MPTFKPAYLIHGDDHGRVAERRANLRARAESESGAEGLEVFEGETSTPETVAAALSAMTLALGHRFVIADGVERWKDGELDPLLAVLEALDEDTTVAFFGRDDGRFTVPGRLADAVRAAGGSVAGENQLKSYELADWVAQQASGIGIGLDSSAAKALVAQVGERQQRLLRELEKLALMYGEGAQLDTEQVEEAVSHSFERKSWSLADALVARDLPAALTMFWELREQGERVEGLLYQMTKRVRTALEVVARLEAGEAEAQVRRSIRPPMPPKAAERFVADVRSSDSETLRSAMCALAALEYDSRGGGSLDKDTAAVRTLVEVAGG